MIQITPTISIDENEVQLEFIRSSGPGGQNVNKVATAVQLRFDVVNSPSLPDEVRQRLMSIAKGRLTEKGVLIIARRFRTQEPTRCYRASDRVGPKSCVQTSGPPQNHLWLPETPPEVNAAGLILNRPDDLRPKQTQISRSKALQYLFLQHSTSTPLL
jgi:hypothetical protein